jgi:hypothetical protein
MFEPRNWLKFLPLAADPLIMVNSISSSHSTQANHAAQSAAPKPPPQPAQQKTAAQPSDTVTLKNTGDANHDGDSK